MEEETFIQNEGGSEKEAQQGQSNGDVEDSNVTEEKEKEDDNTIEADNMKTTKENNGETCTTENEDEEKCTKENEDEETCTTENEDEEACTTENEDEEKCTTVNEVGEKCTTENEDEEKCTTENEDEETCTTENGDEIFNKINGDKICNTENKDEGKIQEPTSCMIEIVKLSTNEDQCQNKEATECEEYITANEEDIKHRKATDDEICTKEGEAGENKICAGIGAGIEVVDEGLMGVLCFVELQANTTSNLFNYIKILEKDILPSIGQTMESLKEQEDNIESEVQSMETSIEEQCKEITSHMENTRKEMNEKIQDDKTKRQDFLAKKKLELEEIQKSSTELLDMCKEHMMKGGQLMMDFFLTKCPSLCNLKAKLQTTEAKSEFERGVIDIPAIRKDIGNLNLHSEKAFFHPLKTVLYTLPRPEVISVVPKIVGGFSTKMTVGDIWVIGDDEAWVTNEENAIITKYNSKGEALKMIDSEGNNESFVIDKDENCLICSFWEKRVIKITPDGDISTFIGELPCNPTCIALNNEGGIVLCMKGYPSLCIYSDDGKLKKAELNIGDPSNKNAGPFEVNPYRVIQNLYGEYIVVDSIWPYKVTSIDAKGKFRWTFLLDQEDVDASYPYNICFKGTNELVLTDIEYQRYHVLTMEGQLIRSVAFKDLGMEDAWSMSRDSKGRIWMGQDDGHISILDLDY